MILVSPDPEPLLRFKFPLLPDGCWSPQLMKPIQALLALFVCAFLPLHAASLDDLTWTTTNGEVTITDGNEAATGVLVIPDTIGGNPVTSIGDSAFLNCTSLTSNNAVVAERDARFTEDQIRTMSVDHTIGQNEAGNMQVKIGFIQSADLNTFKPFPVIPDSLSVVDGKICMEFPPSDDENFFFRFRME